MMTGLTLRELATVVLKGFASGMAPIVLIAFIAFAVDQLLETPSLNGLIALPFTIIGAWMCLFHGKLVLQALRTIRITWF